MKLREQHKLLGIVLLLPFMAWSLTGLFFLVRPAYAQAYARLDVKQYPTAQPLTLHTRPDWLEVRAFNSILGPHLLVRRDGGWVQLDPGTLQERPFPDDGSLRQLVSDAMTANPRRYGALATVDGRRLATDTGVDITLDWNTMSFTQRGRDAWWIDQVYQVHYLQWTGIAVVDKIVGVLGLLLLMYMTVTGFKLILGRDRPARARLAASEPAESRA